MSTQRNSTPQPSRGRNVVAVIAAIVAPIAATIAACSADSVTSPTSATRGASAVINPVAGPVAWMAPAPAPAPAPKPSPKDSTMRQTPAQIAAIAPTWHTQSTDQEAGTDTPMNMMCGVNAVYTVSQPIGPKGGVLQFGASSLTIPQGALSSTVQITATMTLGQAVQVDFAPHGTQFAKAVTIVSNYTGCTMPSGGAVNVYYTNASGGITQSMPSSNDAAHNTVTSLTDHFSGYLVAWGRQ